MHASTLACWSPHLTPLLREVREEHSARLRVHLLRVEPRVELLMCWHGHQCVSLLLLLPA